VPRKRAGQWASLVDERPGNACHVWQCSKEPHKILRINDLHDRHDHHIHPLVERGAIPEPSHYPRASTQPILFDFFKKN